MIHTADLLTAARAEALFTSNLSAMAQPSAVEVAAAIRQAVRRHGGSRGCAANVAQAYGEHPETAAPRMRWARQMVTTVYPQARGATSSQPPLSACQRSPHPEATEPRHTAHSSRRCSMRKLLAMATLATLTLPVAACRDNTANAGPGSAPTVTSSSSAVHHNNATPQGCQTSRPRCK